MENSVILRNLENKLAHQEKPKHEEVERLIKYRDLFSDISRRTREAQHDMELINTTPIKQHPYQLNPRKREIMKTELDYMLKHRIIEWSKSAWVSPCILVDKEDSTMRFCMDYRRINAVTKVDCYPIPRIEDCIDRIGWARFITKCDLTKGYWAIPLTGKAKEISAFVVPDGV